MKGWRPDRVENESSQKGILKPFFFRVAFIISSNNRAEPFTPTHSIAICDTLLFFFSLLLAIAGKKKHLLRIRFSAGLADSVTALLAT